jgi:iron complex outermembrane receptor protein
MSSSSAFSDIRVYLAGNNLFILTGYKGVDPNPRYEDRGSDGTDEPNVLIPGVDRRNTWFRTSSVSLGVTLGF